MILDFGHGFVLRQATEADHPALAMICLKTGDSGKDATAREDAPELLGQIYTIPYQVLEPDLAFIVDGPTGAAGYLLGAKDTKAFNAGLAAKWYPRLQAQVTDPGPDRTLWSGSDWARHQIHHRDFTIPPALAAYPSHGHIDLLPQARGRGIGRRAMAFLEQRLAALGSRGLCLEVMPDNHNALRFYRAIGFAVLQEPGLPDHSIYVAKRLTTAPQIV
ncbi:GNAT family N-acetyltransferase [Mesorhizobium ciceri]|uniref:GNAT family N-acetyltransferase n=1 Tax=Mesorhizobium TaxID=68287 RepID=UPI00047EAA70|nr:GNAT family N-acetyltransferase [Mesorhizobium ciceri]